MLRLIIGNKNYSSWSLRPWLLLKVFKVPFEEVRLPLDTPEFYQRIPEFSPTGRVPVLHDSGRVIWDSLAICEYLNESRLHGKAWPADISARALARCAASEMHSGFSALRSQLPMNCRRVPNAYRWDANADADIRRVQELWQQMGRHTDGPFLLGEFGIVDAMFAPVAIRFLGYGVALGAHAQQYCDALFALPAMREWQRDAEAESERLACDEL